MNRPIIPLEQINRGATLEQINNALIEAYENIQDLNTNAVAARKVTLTISLKPTPDRKKIKFESVATAKLAPTLPQEAMLFTGVTRDGEVAVAAHDLQQKQMFEDNPNIVPLTNTTPN